MTIIEKLENMDRKLREFERKVDTWFETTERKVDTWFETTVRNLCIRYLSTSKK